MEYSVELYLLRLFLEQPEFHKKYQSFIQQKFIHDNNRLLGQLFKSVSQFREAYPDTKINPVDLQVWYLSQYPSQSEADRKLLEKLCTNLSTVVVKPEIAGEYIQRHVEQVRSTELAILALKVSEGKASFEELKKYSKQLDDGTAEAACSFITDDLDELIAAQVSTPGLRFRLGSLRKMLGSLRKGDFGFIFKRPETGGTTLLASEVTFMAEQVDSPILWINNEEQDEKVLLRCYTAYFGVSLQDLVAHKAAFKERYQQEVGGRILLPNPPAFHRRDVERLCGSIKPSLLVIDQLDKVKGFDNDRNDLELTAAYQWARELAKEYCPVIGVCQAGATAEGKKFLTMDDAFGSKTGKQGEADWMLGVGKVHLDGMENIRGLSVVKNKLVGDLDSMPSMRHGKAEVIIQPEIARYKDIGE